MNQPEKIDWANHNPPSKFIAPPPPIGADGKPIEYTVTLPRNIKEGETDDGYLEFLIDPLTLPNGYEIRFTRASVKLFERAGKKVNASPVSTLLRSAGIKATPQTNEEYKAAMKAAEGRQAKVVTDWTAYNKDTGEKINGYKAFPEDPERPGQRKAVLKQGDTYQVLDRQGNVIETRTVQAPVLFANAKVRYYIDASGRR